jgi:iron complex outermembrane receptor protein
MGPGIIPFSSETSDALQGHRQLSQEFRLESLAEGPLKWQGGVYLFREKFVIDSVSYDTIFGAASTSVQTEQTNNAWALFGSVNYAFTPVLNLRGGLRYTHDTKSLSTTTADTAIVTTNGTSADTSDSKLSGDLSGTYVLTPDLNAYARIASGFRASSIQNASAFGPQSKAGPETNISYEAGVKADLFDKRARLSLSVFHYDVKDLQLSAVGGSTNTTTLVSAKRAMGQGIEMNLDAYLTDTLLLTLSGSYNATKIKDPDLVVSQCAQCTPTDPAGAVAGTVHIDGNPMPQAPQWVGNLTLRYGIPAANGGEYFVYTDWAYRSKINFFLYESTEFTGRALTTGGLRLGYNWGNGKYEAAVFARNITNQIRVVGGIDFNNLTGFINEPRTFGAQFKAVF